jgi:hypothetical protein
MEWAKIGGVAMVGLTALLILRAYKPEWAPLVRVAVTVIMLGSLLSVSAAVLSDLSGITASLGAPDVEAYSLLLKALGVAFLTETEDRVPFTDWYFTSQPIQRGFQARTVQGGLFINLLKF